MFLLIINGNNKKFQLSYSILERYQLDKMMSQFVATEEDKNARLQSI